MEDLKAALLASDALIVKAQAILARRLPGEVSPEQALRELLALLDGPEQREVQEATRKALGA